MRCPDTMACYAAKVMLVDPENPGEVKLVGVFAHDLPDALSKIRKVWPGSIVLWVTDGYTEPSWVDVAGNGFSDDELLLPPDVEALAEEQELHRARNSNKVVGMMFAEPVLWAAALHDDVRGYIRYANDTHVTVGALVWGANAINNVRKYLGHVPNPRYPKPPRK